MILFDDIGSYPLPKDVKREWVPEALKKKDPKILNIIRDRDAAEDRCRRGMCPHIPNIRT